ncbi:MAG: hypothetical protein DME26_15115, partial [Verrucomicrobia bacterium]
RRVYFDLIGLPPTPEEMRDFLADKSPEAYERVADRLLASPRYGERWARHWMDVVHFAETHGHDQDRIRTNAWPYRDYLICSFNNDKPYARFAKEQLAGDVLFPDDPQATVALGFIAAGPWDESSLRDIREDTIDRQIGRYLDRDDMITTTMSTFVSTTVHCARCHEHKFDPIPQSDYYSLQAVFAGLERANRPYDLDRQTHLRRQALLKQKAALEKREKKLMASLLEPARQTEVAAWEKSVAANAVTWTPLDPISFISAGGATLAKQADLSVLASGARPDVDTYTISANTDAKGITAVRLEVLTDETLPHQGPGRQDNGNLHLSEFRLKVAPKGAQQVMLQHATADFSQDGWNVAQALDGNEKTAWGIYPQVGKSHQAVFELKEPIAFNGATALTFVLEQKHGGGHLIGRLRLSVTTARLPIRINPFPDDIARILALPADRRNDQQKIALALYYAKSQIEQKLAALPTPQMVYAGASDFVPDGNLKPSQEPRPIHVLKRGDISRPGELASPGALKCVGGLASRFDLENPSDEGARRAALAQWIGDPGNPLTWRSIVNRIWHYHFGRGLIETPNDFGRMGALPTHPELLDWLAVWFLENGESFKQLHKLIVTSAVYRQSSRHTEDFARIDAGNIYLWRMNRTRLDAESVRDAVLQITTKLDLAMGGPSVKQFALSPGIHVTPKVDYSAFNVDNPDGCRRSVYRFIFRTLPDPFMDTLDCADASQLTARRNTSVTALQALTMLNNQFIVRQSEHFAERVMRMSDTLPGQVEAAYQLALGRSPRNMETHELLSYAQKHGLANLCRLILNSNEFMFVN